MNLIDKVIFLLIKAEKPELCLSIMHLCPDIRRRGGFFQRRAEGKEQVYGGQDLVLGALVVAMSFICRRHPERAPALSEVEG